MQHNVIPFTSTVPVGVLASQAIVDDAAATAAADAVIADACIEVNEALAPEPKAEPPAVTVTRCSAVVNRSDLAAAMAVAIRAVEKRNTIPVLSNVLLKASDNGLVIETTNLDMVIRIPVAGSADAGFMTTLPAHTLADVLKKAKASELVALDVKRTATKWDEPRWSGDTGQSVDEHNALDFDGLRVTMKGHDPADFPTMEMPTFEHAFAIPTADLARLFNRTQFAISTEETRYYLNGIFLHVAETNGKPAALRAVATDGHRMGQADVSIPDGAVGMPAVIVPRQAIAEMIRLAKAKGAPATIGVRVHASKTEFTIGNVTLITKNIDGSFPDYARVVPSGNDKRMAVSRAAMLSAIAQVTCLSSERGRAVKLSVVAGNLSLSVSNPDVGAASTTIEADYECNPLDIGFNSGYLTAILEHVESDCAVFMLDGPGDPVLIRGDGNVDDGVVFVLMPMRV